MGEDRREEIQAYEESRETPEKKGEQERVPGISPFCPYREGVRFDLGRKSTMDVLE